MYHEPRGRWVWLLSFHKGGTESKVMPAHQPRGSRQSDLVESTGMTSSQFQVTLHSWATAWEGWQHTSRRIVLLPVIHHSQMVLIWWNLSGCFIYGRAMLENAEVKHCRQWIFSQGPLVYYVLNPSHGGTPLLYAELISPNFCSEDEKRWVWVVLGLPLGKYHLKTLESFGSQGTKAEHSLASWFCWWHYLHWTMEKNVKWCLYNCLIERFPVAMQK